MGKRERARAVIRHVALDPHLSLGDLAAHHGLLVLSEVSVPEGVVADLVPVGHEELELLSGVFVLVEELVRTAGSRQHVERRGPAEIGTLTDERLQHPDARLGIDLELTVARDIAELAWRRVVEREDDRRRAGRDVDASVEQIVEGEQPVTARVEGLQIAAEILGRPRPPLLGVVDLVVLEDHDAAELVRRERLGPGERGDQEGRGQDQRDDQEEPHLAARPSFCLSAALV